MFQIKLSIDELSNLTFTDLFKNFETICCKEGCIESIINKCKYVFPEEFLLIDPMLGDEKINLSDIRKEIFLDDKYYSLRVIVNKDGGHFNSYFRLKDNDFLKMDDLKYKEFNEIIGEEIFCRNGREGKDPIQVMPIIIIYLRNHDGSQNYKDMLAAKNIFMIDYISDEEADDYYSENSDFDNANELLDSIKTPSKQDKKRRKMKL